MLRLKLELANKELEDAKHGPCCDELVKTQEKLKDTVKGYEDYKKSENMKLKVYDHALDVLNKNTQKIKEKASKDASQLKTQLADYESQISEYKKAFDIQYDLRKELQKISRLGKKSQTRVHFSGGKRRTKRRQRKSSTTRH